MAIIKPTIGRVVWYWPSHLAHTSQPYAALIAHVHNDTDINVGYFDHLGVAGSEQHVALLHDDDSYGNPGGGGWAKWMPYQKGQAAKTEALEAKVAGS